MRNVALLVTCLAAAVSITLRAESPTPDQLQFFEQRIRPLLVQECYECHSATAKKIKGGLRLDSKAATLAGGDSGPSLKPGDPDGSLLIKAVRHSDQDLTMPPKKKLPAEQIADLEAWVKMGAPDPRTDDAAPAKPATTIDWVKARQWWSLRPISSPTPPQVKAKRWPINDIDRFLLARMEKANLAPAQAADKRALIRRATYDLIGLPPTPEEIQNFLNDKSKDAFVKVIDRLLDSPRYGERWGRHWLDVVRYADTAGDNSDFPIPQMYRYRDWVIDAFNRDLPYDEFVREQIAGDLLPADEKQPHAKLIATGYLANARRFGSRVDDYPQHLTIEDTIDNLGRAFLGLTINCARCHDHKFDPIPTTDYYGLYGIFHSTRYPWPGIELEQKQRDLVALVSESEAEAGRKAHREKQLQLDAEVKRLEKELKDVKDEPKKKDLEKSVEAAKKAAEKQRFTALPFEQAYAVAEGKKIENVFVQLKGDPEKPGVKVPRHFLTAISGAELPADDKTSGRLQLANWIVARDNPLAARVMANRIWSYHLGRGLVPTPNDFGKQGKPPTHPELLDYLASQFINSGWSIKSMHRLIMNSRAYQQSGQRTPAATERDPSNELLSAFPRQRLDAESIRDTILYISGSLDCSPAGPHPFPPQTEWKYTQHNPFKAVYDTKRRSVYLMTQRIQRHPYLAIFDGADPAASVGARTTSTTPLQALFFLNDSMVHDQSRAFAKRIQTADPKQRLSFAYETALGRPPEKQESETADNFFANFRQKFPEQSETDAWAAFARALFRVNEFVYID